LGTAAAGGGDGLYLGIEQRHAKSTSRIGKNRGDIDPGSM